TAQMRQRKAAEFERLRRDYRQLRDSQWGGANRYDAWINAPMNNARLLPFGLYDQWVPAFAALLRQSGGDWVRFYGEVEKLGALPVEQRRAALKSLAGSKMPLAVQKPSRASRIAAPLAPTGAIGGG